MMRIFITGGSGFIGQHLISVLDKHELLCLSHSQRIVEHNSRTQFILGDLNNPDTYAAALKRFNPDCCIHLAWSGLPDYSIENNTKNLLAGISLFETLEQIGCKKVFSVGTCWEYGNLNGAVKESEQGIEPGVFAAFKLALHTISKSMCVLTGTNLSWGRVFFVYGPGQRKNSLIPSCYHSLKNGAEPKINNPLAKNDFVYISDVVDAIRVLVESDGVSGVYNIGSGKSSAVWEVVNIVATEMGLPQIYKNMPVTTDGNWADMCRMNAIDWKPKFSLELGISNTITALEINS